MTSSISASCNERIAMIHLKVAEPEVVISMMCESSVWFASVRMMSKPVIPIKSGHVKLKGDGFFGLVIGNKVLYRSVSAFGAHL